jgi:hypothetical protein
MNRPSQLYKDMLARRMTHCRPDGPWLRNKGMRVKRFYRDILDGDPGAIATIAASVLYPPLSLAVPIIVFALLAIADALTALKSAVAASQKRMAQHREEARKREQEIQLQHERLAYQKREAERKRQELIERPAPPSKQQLVEALNAELLETFRVIDLALLPDEDKAALKNREIETFEQALRRIVGGPS